ncbi:MAG: hypothetical protein MZV64_64385 [Ignavibacteriales bacterium]|nr:hypothetical protein [Ignavibacteriales bacterium]
MQETSSSLRVSVWLLGGSVESQEIEIIKREMKKRKPVKTFLQEFINNIFPANLLCVFASANYVNGLRIKMCFVGNELPFVPGILFYKRIGQESDPYNKEIFFEGFAAANDCNR